MSRIASLFSSIFVALVSCSTTAPIATTVAMGAGTATALTCTCSCIPTVTGGSYGTGGSPPTTGGQAFTGGKASTGGKAAVGGGNPAGTGGSTNPGNLAHCISDLTKDPGVANVAAKQGMTAKALATKECQDPNVLARHP